MSMVELEFGVELGVVRCAPCRQRMYPARARVGWRGVSCGIAAGLLSAHLAWAQPEPAESAGTDRPAPEQSMDASAGASDGRLVALVDEVGRLRAELAAQSELLRRLMTGLEGLLPSSSQQNLGAAVPSSDQLTLCRSDIAELGARLQQQQLVVDEAQRRAEKAEKAAAAMADAQAQAATEIERLSSELATAKARHSEALQQAVELERRLATAEARLARASTAGLSADGVDSGALAASESPAALRNETVAAEAAQEQASRQAPAASASEEASSSPTGSTSAPVFYEVRAADTLSRISARVYGDPGAWERIYDANRDLLSAPDALAPGMSLVIP